MKNRLIVASMLIGVCLITGCMSPGGLIVGPCSYGTSKINENRMTQRAIMESPAIPLEKKAPLLQAVNMGMDRPGIAVGFGINLAALANENYTGTEIFTQLLGVLGDAALYVGTGYGIKELTKKNSSDSSSSDPAPVTSNGRTQSTTYNVNSGDGSPVTITSTVTGGNRDSDNSTP